MLLVIDIGNTNIVVGAFRGEEIAFEFRLTTNAERTGDEYGLMLASLVHEKVGSDINFSGCIISSVVPPVTPTFVRLVKSRFNIESLVVGPGIKTGLSIKIPDPASVGSDRIVNAVAGKALFGTPALIIDFGTATSFDYVNQSGAYEGGIIAPGPLVSLESLVRHTAKLPRIEISWPESVIGNSTISAMQSGAVLGYASLVDGLIDRVITEVGPIKNIIATGGLGKLFSNHSQKILKYDPYLTMRGMKIIAQLNGISV